jgi:hypothetical protein
MVAMVADCPAFGNSGSGIQITDDNNSGLVAERGPEAIIPLKRF